VLYLVRHGRTDANARGLLLGRADPPLSEEGRAQASALAARIPSGARVVCSPLHRARETAAAFGLPVEVDDRWVELDYGVLDGMPLADVPDDVWRTWRADPAYRPEGGETLVELGARVRSACDELTADAQGGDVVVVSHVSPIKAALAWALRTDDRVSWRIFVEVASIARVAVGPWGATVQSLNERAG
jgi:broad specificity phosphatase PhoE